MDGNTRRLPPWMIPGALSGVTATGSRTDNKSVEGEIKHEAEAPKTKKKRKTGSETDDSEELKKVEIRRRGGGVRRKIKEEEDIKPCIGGVSKSPKMTSPEYEEDLTVDDLLSFAQEYVKGAEEDHAESMVVDVNGDSSMKASQGETNGTRDPASDDMINLLLGPFFNTRR